MLSITVYTRVYVAPAYKSPPKKRVLVWSKIVDPRISRRWFFWTTESSHYTHVYNLHSASCTDKPSQLGHCTTIGTVVAGGGGGGRLGGQMAVVRRR